jgi:CubicO group peptidase (beta-lactamase class C family)
VGKGSEVLYSKALGHLTYSSEDPLTTLDTHFDLASLTKVFSTTSAVALLYEQGILSVHDKVAQYLGDDFKVNGKDDITIENCLLHNAGFSPDPDPCYWYPEFACPNTADGNIVYASSFMICYCVHVFNDVDMFLFFIQNTLLKIFLVWIKCGVL